MTTRLTQQFAFLQEIDKLKGILRATAIADGSRPENSGEHSWHIAMYAMVLADQAGSEVDITRVIKMLLIHDIVEIDAGDAPIHSQFDTADQDAKEQRAADRIFNLLPEDQSKEFRALWDEFEAAMTPDAIFGKAIDRVQPLLLNLANDGSSWKEYDVTLAQIDSRIGEKVNKGAPWIWAYIREKIKPWFATRGLD